MRLVAIVFSRVVVGEHSLLSRKSRSRGRVASTPGANHPPQVLGRAVALVPVPTGSVGDGCLDFLVAEPLVVGAGDERTQSVGAVFAGLDFSEGLLDLFLGHFGVEVEDGAGAVRVLATGFAVGLLEHVSFSCEVEGSRTF